MKWALRLPRLSDDDLIARFRKNIGNYDRWKCWFLGLALVQLALLIALAASLSWFAQHLIAVDALGLWGGLGLGILFGMMIGTHARHTFDMLTLDHFRTERLAVKYYDAALKAVALDE